MQKPRRQHLVRDIMTRNPRTVPLDLHLSEAAELMRQEDIQHLVVTRQGVPVGILSAQDLHDAVPSVNLVPDPEERRAWLKKARVSDVATMNPRTVTSETPVVEAIRVLRRHRVGSRPVKDAGDLVGSVTAGDFITLLEKLLAGDGALPASWRVSDFRWWGSGRRSRRTGRGCSRSGRCCWIRAATGPRSTCCSARTARWRRCPSRS